MAEAKLYLGAVRRSWRLLAVLALAGAVVAVLLPVSSTKAKSVPYHWQSAALVGAIPVDGIGSSGVNNQTILYYANLYYAKYTALKAVGLEGSFAQIIPLMSGSPTSSVIVSSTSTTSARAARNSGGLSLVQLSAPGVTPALAAKLANAYSDAVGKEVNDAYQARLQQAANAKTPSTLPANSGFNVVEPAFPTFATHTAGPAPSVTASHKVRLVMGIALGLLLGALIVLVRELRDKTLKTKARTETAFGFPVVAELPARSNRAEGGAAGAGLEVWTDPWSPTAETYRMLRISINFEELADLTPPDPFAGASAAWQLAPKEPYRAPAAGSRQVVMVVSPGDEQARAVVAANLAATYSEAGQKVVVISTADIEARRPVGDVPLPVTGPSDVEPYLQPSSLEHVWQLSLRPFVTSSGQLVNRAPAVMDALRELTDLVIVEAGPLLSVHHGEALARCVDVVLVVAECGSTSEIEAEQSGALVRRVGMPVLGVVLADSGVVGRRPSVAAAEPATASVPAGDESVTLESRTEDDREMPESRTEPAREKDRSPATEPDSVTEPDSATVPPLSPA